MTAHGDGVWLAFYGDWSGWRVFKSEMQALRHAVANSMSVVFLPYGADPVETVNPMRTLGEKS